MFKSLKWIIAEFTLNINYVRFMNDLNGYLYIKGERENYKEVNDLQRSLSDLAIHAYKHSKFFTAERVNDASRVLDVAALYLGRNSRYVEIGESRASSFVGRVLSCKKAAYATKRLEEEFSQAINKTPHRNLALTTQKHFH